MKALSMISALVLFVTACNSNKNSQSPVEEHIFVIEKAAQELDQICNTNLAKVQNSTRLFTDQTISLHQTDEKKHLLREEAYKKNWEDIWSENSTLIREVSDANKRLSEALHRFITLQDATLAKLNHGNLGDELVAEQEWISLEAKSLKEQVQTTSAIMSDLYDNAYQFNLVLSYLGLTGRLNKEGIESLERLNSQIDKYYTEISFHPNRADAIVTRAKEFYQTEQE